LEREFPITREWAYFNHAAVAPLPARVAASVRAFAEEASQKGATNYAAWKACLNETRKLGSLLVGCEPNEIAFVKNTTHGLMCVANSLDWREGDNVVSFDGEFPANYWPWRNLERLGVQLRLASLRNGLPCWEDLEEICDSRTRLAAVSFVGYANGCRLDGSRLGEICRRRGILSCVDAIQGIGAIPFDAHSWGLDFVSADSHKWMLGPEGIGLLFCSKRVIDQLNNSMTGWCSHRNYSDYEDTRPRLWPDARRFEEGSHNMMSVHALNASLNLLLEVGIGQVSARLQALTDRLVDSLKRDHWEVVSRADRENGRALFRHPRPGWIP